ncbi:dnaJ homolog subfamily C member 3-like [Daphnia carinata]|uniref:dnaJ homolog subfamily C member 3-like n=1 Tax=Daphnia carinata TaxID=120202 RepID=UPI00257BD534|nr:dnaJ homolog subfamily C member 3-like [Daphnia carinata]
MPFFTVLPCLIYQWQSIFSATSEKAVAESAPVAITNAASGSQDQSEDPIDLPAENHALNCVVEPVPKSEDDCGIQKKCNERALKVQLADLMEEKDVALSANKQLLEIIYRMKLEATEASAARDELTRQNIELQDELVKKDCDLQRAEQEMKDIVFSKHQGLNKVGLMQKEIRNLKIRRMSYEERMSRLEQELADKENQRKVEQAHQRAKMEHTMALHAKQLNDIESENKVLVQRMVKEHQLDVDEQRVHYESAMEGLRNQLEKEHEARLHSALQEAKVQYAAKYSEVSYKFQMQVRGFRNNADSARMKAEQLATNLEECKKKFSEMETANRLLKEALNEQKATSDAHFDELLASHETIGRMRVFHAKLLENRDRHIEQLQRRIEELEKRADKDVEVVGPDYYKLLGVGRNAGKSEVKSAYYAKSRIHHPDKHRGSPDQKKHEAIFKTIKYGYEVISNSHSRRKYDKWLDMTSVRLAHQAQYC